MKILFCDDDPEILQQMQKYVAEYFRSNNLKQPEFCSYSLGDQVIKDKTSADIAFLDVEMPGQSGIYVGRYLMKANPYTKVFIVTSHSDYLDEAMRFHIFRYLSKPVDKNRLFRNLKDALYQLSVETKTIVAETHNGVITCYSDEIVYLEQNARKIFLHTSDAVYQVHGTMEQWHSKLNLPCFYTPYQNFIINMKYVSCFEKDVIFLKYGEKEQRIYLVKRKYTDFKHTYLLYMESIT
ncbi:MAG: LytR/AlgR family response regulator transcription factor [Massiliimalia sp.]